MALEVGGSLGIDIALRARAIGVPLGPVPVMPPWLAFWDSECSPGPDPPEH